MKRESPDPSSSECAEFVPAVLGSRAAELDLGWARVIDAVHDPDLSLAPHEHRRSAFTFVRSGGFRLTWGSEEVDCAPRTVFFKRGAQRHSNRFSPEGTRSFVIELMDDDGRVDRSGVQLGLPSESSLLGVSASRLAGEIEREWRDRDRFSQLAIEGHLLVLLSELGRDDLARTQEPQWLRTVDEALHALPARPPSVAELAGLAGVEPRRLPGLYRRHRGTSIGGRLRSLRLEKAQQLVRESSLSLAEIGADLGFYDQAHFTRSFKAKYGVTPGALRRSSSDGTR